MVDANGVAIALNDTVKLEGTVVALDPANTHYREVTIRLTHPVAGVPPNAISTDPSAGGTVNPRTEGGNTFSPGCDVLIKACNLMIEH